MDSTSPSGNMQIHVADHLENGLTRLKTEIEETTELNNEQNRQRLEEQIDGPVGRDALETKQKGHVTGDANQAKIQ